MITNHYSDEQLKLLSEFLRSEQIEVSQIKAIRRDEAQNCFPLSLNQRQLWFLQQLHPQLTAYNVTLAFQLDGALDYDALRAALQEIVQRHEILRTSFQTREGQPVQVIAPSASLDLPCFSLKDIAPDLQESKVQERIRHHAAQPFDLSRDLLIRPVLWQLNEQRHVFAFTVHHIAFDNWSRGVFFSELSQLYATMHRGGVSSLPALPVQYVDFACWQQEQLQCGRMEEEIVYWREQLADAPATLDLPTDYPRPAEQSYRGALLPVNLPASLSRALERLSLDKGCTLFMSLLAAFQVLLWRYSGQEELTIGVPIANRTQLEVEALVGFFANTLVLRGDLSGNPSFRQLLERVRSGLSARCRRAAPGGARDRSRVASPRGRPREPTAQVMRPPRARTRRRRRHTGLRPPSAAPHPKEPSAAPPLQPARRRQPRPVAQIAVRREGPVAPAG